MNSGLSVILPIYNVQAYLPVCLDSLMAQTVQPDEIIAVDDGSTDNSPQILADYALRMPNLKVIRQENAGQSVARNTGLDVASGEFVAFVDADDFVAPDLYDKGLRYMRDERLEILLFNGVYYFEGRKPDCLIYPNADAVSGLSGEDWLLKHLKVDRLLHYVVIHIYRRKFLKDNCFRFVPGLIYEDVLWTTQVLLAAKHVCYDSTPFYYYRISVRKFSVEEKARQVRKIIDSSVFNVQSLAKIAKNAHRCSLRTLLQAQLVDGAFSVFHKLKQLPKPEAKQRLRILRKEGFFKLLWSNAHGFTQHRRIIRYWLYSLVVK
ncbi:MAG: glycosyltransferase [Thiothrix sp.]|uniref:glycosyltransferase n=1 Tax=Thiothrix sp. TaxID=1032 RepID=UPI002604FE0E|nr:glycosyltransferase [Thiothrix sp.]MDD5394639.1 glycosyltransferase [Thiothrix sp.]